MALIKAKGEANAASKATQNSASGDAAKLGYVSVDLPTSLGAKSEADISITSASNPALDSMGTSSGSYSRQGGAKARG